MADEEEGAFVGQPVASGRVSHMNVTELVNFGLQLRNRSEAEWQRVINLHAALIGAMIFFAGQPDPYVTARLVVFAFYSFNVASSFLSLRETFDGLARVSDDLGLFPRPDRGGGSFDWIASRRFGLFVWARSGLLICVWAVVGYLMVVPLITGSRILWP